MRARRRLDAHQGDTRQVRFHRLRQGSVSRVTGICRDPHLRRAPYRPTGRGAASSCQEALRISFRLLTDTRG